jgi:hypothetical protein
MPVPYRYFAAPGLPELELDQKVTSEAQLAMPWGDETAHTTMTYLGLAEGEAFERYSVEHQVDVEVDAIYEQKPVKRIIEVRRFFAFYLRDKEYFLVQGPKRDARGAFERLEKAKPPVVAAPGELDLDKLSQLGQTTGAWFGKLKIADVNTTAVFGTETVVDSEEWARYTELGELSVVYMRLQDGGGVYRKVMVSRDRFVLLMQNVGEGANLEFVAQLQEAIDNLV